MIAVICPGAAANDTSRSAWMPPKRRSTPSTDSAEPAGPATGPAGRTAAERRDAHSMGIGIAHRRAAAAHRTPRRSSSLDIQYTTIQYGRAQYFFARAGHPPWTRERRIEVAGLGASGRYPAGPGVECARKRFRMPGRGTPGRLPDQASAALQVAEQVVLHRVERLRGVLELLVGQAGEDLLVHAMADLAHAGDQLLALRLEEDAIDAPVVGVGLAPHQARLLEPVDQPADRHLAEIELLGELRLRHAVLARQIGEHPPLRTGHVQRLQAAVEGAAAQARHVVNEEPEPELPVGGVRVCRHGCCRRPRAGSITIKMRTL